jgi:Tfp pilus assembly protein PilZ
MARRLQLVFRDGNEFLEEYQRNIAVGGAFIRSAQDFEPRETVCVELRLDFCDASLDLEAEVVHRVPPRPDAPDAAGVAVQFHAAADELRRRLDRFARAAEEGGAPEPEPPPAGAKTKPVRQRKAPLMREEILPRREVRPSKTPARRRPRTTFAPSSPRLVSPEPSAPPRAAPSRSVPPPARTPLAASTPRATAGPAAAGEADVGADVSSEDLEILLADMSAEEDQAQGRGDDGDVPGAGRGFDPQEFVLDGDAAAEEQPSDGEDAARLDAAGDPFDPFERGASLEIGAADPQDASGPGSSHGSSREAAPESSAGEWVLEDEGELAPDSGAEAGEADPEPGHEEAAEAADADRRRDRREAARVPVRLDATHVSLDGRTRDLSESGLLVSVDGTELPIGKAVSISLVHPETGEALEVRGRVARHVPTDGTVAAVGIRFEPEAGAGEQLAERVRELKEAERERRRRGISGAVDEIGLANLLQALARCSPRGTLTVVCGREEGVIAFDDGFLCYARIGSLRGEKALARLLGWQEGWFEFHSRVDAMPAEEAPVLLEAAILEAARQLDEASREENASFDPAAKLRVDMKLLTRENFELDKTEQAVIDLAVAGFTIRRILDVIPEPDSRVLDALRSLEDRGLVTLAD